MSADGEFRRAFPPPRRRPGLGSVLVRWRAELLIVGLVATMWAYTGGAVVGALALGGGVLVAFVPAVRSVAVGASQALIVMHRIRSGLVQAGVADRSGRLPWIVGARSRGEVVLVSLWLHGGTTLDDLRGARTVLATACGAVEVEVYERSPRRDRAVLAVARPRWGWPSG